MSSVCSIKCDPILGKKKNRIESRDDPSHPAGGTTLWRRGCCPGSALTLFSTSLIFNPTSVSEFTGRSLDVAHGCHSLHGGTKKESSTVVVVCLSVVTPGSAGVKCQTK